ncbi:2-C-methyl-D-erythritol 2,4-cyclodiphosphate synthase [Candidatus Zixiibacteriota bacterium]
MRIGFGYDAHALAEGRKLILGGVTVPFERGLQGHSDADVLCHAVGDALLGAAALGDLGSHFPDSDPKFKGISSLKLLEQVRAVLADAEFQILNIDATLVVQRPRIATYISRMRELMAAALDISAGKVSVKATTTEGMGFSGRQEGMEAFAVALVAER